MNTEHTADLWPPTKTKTGQRGRDGGKRRESREKTEVGVCACGVCWYIQCSTAMLCLRVLPYLWQSNIYASTPKHPPTPQTHTYYLSVEAPVLTAALSASSPPRLLHLHFLWILQLQGLQLLNDTRATADTQNSSSGFISHVLPFSKGTEERDIRQNIWSPPPLKKKKKTLRELKCL